VDRRVAREERRHIHVPGAGRGRVDDVREVSGEEEDLADFGVGGAVGRIVDEIDRVRDFTTGRRELRANRRRSVDVDRLEVGDVDGAQREDVRHVHESQRPPAGRLALDQVGKVCGRHLRRLAVEGRVPGLDDAGFRQEAQTAKENCPVSKALAGVPEISLEASLAG